MCPSDFHPELSLAPSRTECRPDFFSAIGSPVFSIRYSSANGIKKGFSIYQLVVVFRRQENPGWFTILRNNQGVPGTLEALEPPGDAGLEFGNRDNIIFNGNGFHATAPYFDLFNNLNIGQHKWQSKLLFSHNSYGWGSGHPVI